MRVTFLYEVIGLCGRITNFAFPIVFSWVIGLESYGEWILSTSLGLLIANLTDCRLLIWGARKDTSELLFIEILFAIIGLSVCVLVLLFLSLDVAVVLGSYIYAVFGRLLGWIAFFNRSRYLLRISQGFLPGVAGVMGLFYVASFENVTNLAVLRFGVPLIIFFPLCWKYFPTVDLSFSHCRKSMSNFNRVLILKLGKQIVGNALINQVDKILVGLFFSNASLGAYALFTSAHAGINMFHSYWINILVAVDKKYQFYFISGANFFLSICLGVFQSDLHDFVTQFFKKWEPISAFFTFFLVSNVVTQGSFFSRYNFLNGIGLSVANVFVLTGVAFNLILLWIGNYRPEIEFVIISYLAANLLIVGANLAVYVRHDRANKKAL